MMIEATQTPSAAFRLACRATSSAAALAVGGAGDRPPLVGAADDDAAVDAGARGGKGEPVRRRVGRGREGHAVLGVFGYAENVRRAEGAAAVRQVPRS